MTPDLPIRVNNMDDLVAAFRLRRRALGLSLEAVDNAADPSWVRYAEKLENPQAEHGRGLSGLSLFLLADTLGLELLLVPTDLPRSTKRELRTRERQAAWSRCASGVRCLHG